MDEVIEIFGKRLKIVTDESNSADFCKRCALEDGCCENLQGVLSCEDAEGKLNRHFELIEIKEEK